MKSKTNLPPMPAMPDQPKSAQDFMPEEDLKGLTDWLDAAVPTMEGEQAGAMMEPVAGDPTTLVTEDMDKKEIEQVVSDNMEAFIDYLKTMGAPKDWPGDLPKHIRMALKDAWSGLSRDERNDVKAAYKGAMEEPIETMTEETPEEVTE